MSLFLAGVHLNIEAHTLRTSYNITLRADLDTSASGSEPPTGSLCVPAEERLQVWLSSA